MMALDITQFTTHECLPVKLLDGKEYPCRQISAAGYKLIERIGRGDVSVTVDDLIACVRDLLGAPVEQVERLSVPQLTRIIAHSAKSADEMNAAINEDAEKNGKGGRVKATRPRR